ncbi:hypothetical protein NF867_08265 [Solitalea sp. MAHUQ-68]|uniref:Cytochrome c domain-containing protein n=1 Tax=Solitalea agri TaxID=2953739 RepID=A0A9X2F268_9SPHI|nr:cytochrome c peroxidase [Solitalea agri]MCO4292851.1 hypothetical protein [Solitalea agri]
MQKKIIVIVIALSLVASFQACLKKSNNAETVRASLLIGIDDLKQSILKLEGDIRKNATQKQVQHDFLEARFQYKKIEFLVEYFCPYTADFINGAPLDEIEVADKRVIAPEGFQVIEPFIFPSLDTTNKQELLGQVHSLAITMNRLTDQANTIPVTDQHVFDAMRLEVYRIISMGISGFDTPSAQNSMNEAAAAILSMQQTLRLYNQDSEWGTAAVQYLQKHSDFNSFNRLQFITDFANPLSTELHNVQLSLGIQPFKELRAVKTTVVTLFDEDAFDENFFTPNYDSHTSTQKVALGKMLFFDPILSGNHNRACVSCHQPEKAFTDGLEKSVAFDEASVVERNAPTLLNSGFQKAQFYDSRVSNLEDQAAAVINNKNELHGSFEKAVTRLKGSVEYVQLFKKAFPAENESISSSSIKNAIAAYVRSLKSMNSRFDQYVRGDKSKMNKDEIVGFNIFMGKGKCGTCHFAPLFNGTVPPNYDRSESEVIGVPQSNAAKSKLDGDRGKFNLYQFEQYRYSFKTPTVRNIALTAPYMHNGAFKTLEEVIDFYNKGGAAGIGADLPYLTLPFDKLNLTENEKKQLVAFMKTLTDTSVSSSMPKQLPKLAELTASRKATY